MPTESEYFVGSFFRRILYENFKENFGDYGVGRSHIFDKLSRLYGRASQCVEF